MSGHKLEAFQITQQELWSTTISNCSAALSLLAHYEKYDYALVNEALRSLRQLVGQGSNFDNMRTVTKVPSTTAIKRKTRELKSLSFNPKEHWKIINESEIQIPVEKGRYITAIAIDTAERLDAIIPILSKADKIAIDCEFLGEKNKEPEVKCIQLAPSDSIGYAVLVDRIGVDVIYDKLHRILNSPRVNRIGWAMQADAPALERLFDITLGHTLDLQVKLKDVAGETLNLASAVTQFAKSWDGYDRLIEAKSMASSFNFTGQECVWTQYPLPPAALVYSVFDVVGLYALYEATSLHLTLSKHYWPDCKIEGHKSKSSKSSRITASKSAVPTDSMEEFEFDPHDEDFIDFPRATPLSSIKEDKKYMDDLKLAVQLSLQDTNFTDVPAIIDNETDVKPKDAKEADDGTSKRKEPETSSISESRKGSNPGNKTSSRKKPIDNSVMDIDNDEEHKSPVHHYSLSSSSVGTDKGKKSSTSDTASKADSVQSEVTTVNEDEEIELWKGFAMQRWSMGEDVNVDESTRSTQWQSPAPRPSTKDFKSSPIQENRLNSKPSSPRSPGGRREKPHADSKKRNHRDNNNGSLSRDDAASSDDSQRHTTPVKLRGAQNLHPILIQKNQAIAEDNFESDMVLDDGAQLHLHTINTPQRLAAMKLTDANKALTSTIAIIGHFEETSNSKHKKLRAIQLLTESNDAFTILVDSAIPDPAAIRHSLFEHILTSSTIHRVAWDFKSLGEHIESRLGITPGKTFCLYQNLGRLSTDITLTAAITQLMNGWAQKALFAELQNEKAATHKPGKFVDYWAKTLPPYQLIRAGILECKAIADLSHLDIFQSAIDADYWDSNAA